MNYTIATVYKTKNCGSFLQAFALSFALEKNGIKAKFLNYIDENNVCRDIIKCVLKFDFKAANRIILQEQRFKKAYKRIDIIDNIDSSEFLILGSDTIWDITNPYFRQYKNIFWGNIFTGNKISYAPSIGSATYADFQMEANWISETFDSYSYISVRDHRAKEIIQKFTDKQVEQVCDPTFLLTKEEYLGEFQAEFHNDDSRYVFVYYYGKMPEKYISEIKTLANELNAKIVLFGNGNNWGDLVEPFDPIRFIELYFKALLVITNTFHGTVFSHIFEKQFCVLGSKKKKVNDLLEHYGTTARVVGENGSVLEVFESYLPFDFVREQIKKDREDGLAYLEKACEI